MKTRSSTAPQLCRVQSPKIRKTRQERDKRQSNDSFDAPEGSEDDAGPGSNDESQSSATNSISSEERILKDLQDLDLEWSLIDFSPLK